ncbi:MAG: hypothetical protein U0269_31095 [Polyangiales bacterium]
MTGDSRTSEEQWIARRLVRTREAGVSGIVSGEPRFSRRVSGAHWLWFDGDTARATGRLTADALSRAGSELVCRMWREIENARTQNVVTESLPEFLNVRVAREGDREAEAGDAIRAELLSLARGLTARE